MKIRFSTLRQIIKEAYASGGFDYEIQVQKALQRAGLGPKKATAGSGHGADAAFFGPDGKEYGLEVKDSPNVFAGQKNCLYDGKSIIWSTPDSLTSLYDEMGLRSIILKNIKGNLDAIMENLGIDRLPASMTNEQYWKAHNRRGITLELGTYPVQPSAIYRNYVNKNVHYIQIGSGFGFYYLDADVAGLGVPQFAPSEVKVRARIKWGGSSAGIKRSPSYDKDKASDPNVAKSRSGLSLNCGLIFKGLSPSNFDVTIDPSFLSGESAEDEVEVKKPTSKSKKRVR